MKIKSVAKGFTLIELLVVVLIIGVLTAVALPGYRKSVEKSRVADALTTMGAVAKSEHAWYLEHSNYTDDFANLDIELTGTINEGALETDFYTYELLDTGILAERNNGEYFVYKDYENQQILCTPGTHYICEDLGAFTKVPCEKVGMTWANTDSTCYINDEARCKGLYPDDNFWLATYCGYNRKNYTTVNEGMMCYGWDNDCKYTTVNDGGVCKGNCQYSTINAGGQCIGLGQSHCSFSTINAGGLCTYVKGGWRQNVCNNITINGGECDAQCSYSTVTAGGECAGNCYRATVSDGGVCSGTCESATINQGGICSGTCQNITVNSGGVCSGGCSSAQIKDGGVCSGDCYNSTINDGGICKSSPTNKCYIISGPHPVRYKGTGCCCGDNCGNAPKCDQARCDALD